MCSSFVSTALGSKQRSPVHYVGWTPDGRRVCSATQSGEISLWHGTLFYFENVMQVRRGAVAGTRDSTHGLQAVPCPPRCIFRPCNSLQHSKHSFSFCLQTLQISVSNFLSSAVDTPEDPRTRAAPPGAQRRDPVRDLGAE